MSQPFLLNFARRKAQLPIDSLFSHKSSLQSVHMCVDLYSVLCSLANDNTCNSHLVRFIQGINYIYKHAFHEHHKLAIFQTASGIRIY